MSTNLPEIGRVTSSPTAEVLRRIQEVRNPITAHPPRGWLSVGLPETLSTLLLPFVVVAGLFVLGRHLGDIQSLLGDLTKFSGR